MPFGWVVDGHMGVQELCARSSGQRCCSNSDDELDDEATASAEESDDELPPLEDAPRHEEDMPQNMKDTIVEEVEPDVSPIRAEGAWRVFAPIEHITKL